MKCLHVIGLISSIVLSTTGFAMSTHLRPANSNFAPFRWLLEFKNKRGQIYRVYFFREEVNYENLDSSDPNAEEEIRILETIVQQAPNERCLGLCQRRISAIPRIEWNVGAANLGCNHFVCDRCRASHFTCPQCDRPTHNR